MRFGLLGYICFVLFFSSGCKRNTGNNIEQATAQDTIILLQDSVKDEIQPRLYSQTELNLIMDSLNKTVNLHPSIFNNIQVFGVRDGYILVELFDGSDEKVSEFKKQIMNSPAIRFEEIIPLKPDGKECISCGFELIVSPNSYKLPVTSINATIKNNTNDEGTTGELFFIEFFDNEGWKPVSLNYFFIAIGYGIMPNESHDFIINIQPQTHKYSPGLYRLYKTVINNVEKYNLVAEFTLE